MSAQTLVEALRLEPLEVNLFRGFTPLHQGRDRIFGGQVIAQALFAAYATVEQRTCHSLHCYFIRGGDPSIPIVFEVDRARDGGSFTTRRVIALQQGKQIFNLAASFQDEEEGFEHQSAMPEAPDPDSVEEDVVTLRRLATTPQLRALAERPQPIEMRTVGGSFFAGALSPGPSTLQIWFRAREPIGDDPHMHQVVMAYASDFGLLSATMRPHSGKPGAKVMFASLDHAMWFHRPTDFNEWHLFHQDSPSASGGRGFALGQIYRASDGALVASCAQEGLIRRLREQ